MKVPVILLLVLSGCSTPPQGQSFCTAARPIFLGASDKLSVETLRLVIGHNEVGARLCGWKPPS